MSGKTIKERAKKLIDNLSTNQARVILKLLERFNEKEEWEATRGEGKACPT